MFPDHERVISALTADGDDLDRLVANLTPEQWALATPAEGWTVAHQIAHLAATFHLAGTAASDPEGFAAMAATLTPDFNANVDGALQRFLDSSPATMLGRWHAVRAAAEKALAAAPRTSRCPGWSDRCRRACSPPPA